MPRHAEKSADTVRERPQLNAHRALDEDTGAQREAENAGAAVAQAVKLRREGKLPAVGSDLVPPRPE